MIIIAEAGVNHNGSIKLAKKLISVAADAKADYVKFQTYKTEANVTKNAEKAEYQKLHTDQNETQFDMIKKLELGLEAHEELIKHCKNKKIKFLSTAFDLESIEMLDDMNIEFYKIPSGEITNLPYLRRVALKRKPVFLSTGMSNLEEVKTAIKVLTESGVLKQNITILHCNTQYPTPFSDVNLKAMKTIRDELGVSVGYSDHTRGIEIPIAAAAMGATVIEKHFTLNRNFPGPDHSASLEPDELKLMVSAIRNIELAMGDGIKRPSNSEKENLLIVRKSIVAKRKIKAGDLFSKNNITTKRPGIGISPMKWDSIIGSRASKEYMIDDIIKEDI